MEQNGWIFVNLESKPTHHNGRLVQCDDDTWYGISTGNGLGVVSAIFTGSGTATLTFGKCGSQHAVVVYVNNSKIATAYPDELKRTTTFNFFEGSKLRIETNNAIIKLNSLEISCNEGKAL